MDRKATVQSDVGKFWRAIMSEENKIESVESTEQTTTAPASRRRFVKIAAGAAIAAPAVALLLNAASKPASAATVYRIPT
jgi:hypothetical protein